MAKYLVLSVYEKDTNFEIRRYLYNVAITNNPNFVENAYPICKKSIINHLKSRKIKLEGLRIKKIIMDYKDIKKELGRYSFINDDDTRYHGSVKINRPFRINNETDWMRQNP